jgi:hypothetical protein
VQNVGGRDKAKACASGGLQEAAAGRSVQDHCHVAGVNLHSPV